MKSLKLKSQTWQRRRFVLWEDQGTLNFSNWFLKAIELKKQIVLKSSFQIVGSKIILEKNSESESTFNLMYEVTGPPQNGFLTRDDNGPFQVLRFELEESAFEIDFESLMSKVQELKKAIPHKLTPKVQIVIDGPKLELHFFVQKDYIQT